MNVNIENQNVFITGSSRGIGKGLAEAFLTERANVITHSLSQDPSFSRHFTNHLGHIKADLSLDSSISVLREEMAPKLKDKLSTIICNLGSGTSVPPGQETFNDWEKSFEINFFSATRTIEALSEKLLKDGSSIIFISSICGIEQLGAPLTYSAAKSALNSYVVGLSKVLGKRGVRVNAIAPGNIMFPGSTWEKKLKDSPQKVNSLISNNVALSRFGTIDDLANLAIFLASSLSSFITGSIIVADGGQLRSW